MDRKYYLSEHHWMHGKLLFALGVITLTIGQLMFFYSLLGYLLGPLERLAAANLKAILQR
jgi:ABC-type bacteriocin/lantibiotic exporter with double-glycine peptidase domain